ncbi:MAG: hypothetical protein BACC_04459 [Bacteroides sp.]
MAANAFTIIFDTVDSAIETYVTDTSTNAIEFATPVFTSMMILFVAIWGFMMMYGQIQEPLKDGVFRIIRIGLIMTLALTVGTYAEVVVSLLQTGPEYIASAITGSETANTAGTLDTLFSKVLTVAKSAWEKGGVMNGNFGLYLVAAVVLVVGGILTLLVAFLILLAKVMLALMLGVGPLFIIMLLFQSTQKFFESWLGMTVNFGILMVLATGIGKLMTDISESFIFRMAPTESALKNMSNLVDAAVMCIMFGLCILVMKQVTSLAASLGGGIALHTQGAISNGFQKLRPSTAAKGIKGIRRDYRAAVNGVRKPVQAGAAAAAAVRKRFNQNTVSSS